MSRRHTVQTLAINMLQKQLTQETLSLLRINMSILHCACVTSVKTSLSRKELRTKRLRLVSTSWRTRALLNFRLTIVPDRSWFLIEVWVCVWFQKFVLCCAVNKLKDKIQLVINKFKKTCYLCSTSKIDLFCARLHETNDVVLSKSKFDVKSQGGTSVFVDHCSRHPASSRILCRSAQKQAPSRIFSLTYVQNQLAQIRFCCVTEIEGVFLAEL